MPDERHLIKAPDVLLQDLDGEAVLLNLANGTYYGLDENSYHMYQTLISASSVQAAFEILAREFEVEPEQLRSDLQGFVAQLLENGILRDSDDKIK